MPKKILAAQKKKESSLLKKTFREEFSQQKPKRSTKARVALRRARKPVPRPEKKQLPAFEKALENPILSPIHEHEWEAWQTFNPAAFTDGKKIYLLYRALGPEGISRLGLATTCDGTHIEERLNVPVYTSPPPDYSRRYGIPPPGNGSGGGWAGAEDPRVTRIDGRLYILYVAMNGWESVRIALTSISVEDFLAQRWNWRPPVYISPPGEIHKCWVLFPEKIHGKYAILHSLVPEILIHYVSSLDVFDGTTFIRSVPGDRLSMQITPLRKSDRWDNAIRGAGPPPIKTKHGWLLFYQAIDRRNPGKYKIGAMLLDLDDPTVILHRSPWPVLEPDEPYENQGHKSGIVYSCGAVVFGETLFLYYGGADTVVGAASAHFETFVQALVHSHKPTLTKLRTISVKK